MAGDKYIYNNSGNLKEKAAVQTSAGAGDANKIPALDSNGRLDSTMMPVGVSSETKSIAASENLAAGDFVNVYSNAGTLNVRKADASSTSKRAHGYVLAAVTSGNNATIYYGNLNNQLTGMTVGAQQFLSGATPGAPTGTAPSTTGYLVQSLGVATSATELLVEIDTPIELA